MSKLFALTALWTMAGSVLAALAFSSLDESYYNEAMRLIYPAVGEELALTNLRERLVEMRHSSVSIRRHALLQKDV